MLGKTWLNHTERSASRTLPLLFTTSESTATGEPWFHLSTNKLRLALSSHNCTMGIPPLHKMTLTENLGGNFCCKKLAYPLFWRNAIWVATWIWVSQAADPFAQMNALYSLLHSKINFSLHMWQANWGITMVKDWDWLF